MNIQVAALKRVIICRGEDFCLPTRLMKRTTDLQGKSIYETIAEGVMGSGK